MFTTRRRSAAQRPLASGVTAQTLYRAHSGQALRPGEPLRATLVELAPGARFSTAAEANVQLNDASLHREWLVLSGSAVLNGETLSQRDYHVTPAGQAPAQWTSDDGVLLFLRESHFTARPGDQTSTVRDAGGQ